MSEVCSFFAFLNLEATIEVIWRDICRQLHSISREVELISMFPHGICCNPENDGDSMAFSDFVGRAIEEFAVATGQCS